MYLRTLGSRFPIYSVFWRPSALDRLRRNPVTLDLDEEATPATTIIHRGAYDNEKYIYKNLDLTDSEGEVMYAWEGDLKNFYISCDPFTRTPLIGTYLFG